MDVITRRRFLIASGVVAALALFFARAKISSLLTLSRASLLCAMAAAWWQTPIKSNANIHFQLTRRFLFLMRIFSNVMNFEESSGEAVYI